MPQLVFFNRNSCASAKRALWHTTDLSSIVIGAMAGAMAGANLTIGDSNIEIGNAGAGGESGTIRIGVTGFHTNSYIAGINGVTVASWITVWTGWKAVRRVRRVA